MNCQKLLAISLCSIVANGCMHSKMEQSPQLLEAVVGLAGQAGDTELSRAVRERLLHIIKFKSKPPNPLPPGVATVSYPPFDYRITFIFKEGYEWTWESTGSGKVIRQPRTNEVRVVDDPESMQFVSEEILRHIQRH